MKRIGVVRAALASGILLASMAGCSGKTTLSGVVEPSPTPTVQAVTLKECDLLTDSDFAGGQFRSIEDATAIHTRPADVGGWLTECQYGDPDTHPEPDPALVEIYVDADWDKLWKQFEKSASAAGKPKAIKDFGDNGWVKTDMDDRVEVLARKGNAVLIVHKTGEAADPTYIPIEIAKVAWSRLPERSRVETNDLGAACSQVDRKAAGDLLGSELTAAREFRNELGDTTCTFNGLDGARVIVTSSANSLALSTFKNHFATKENRFTKLRHDAVLMSLDPDQFEIMVGKHVVTVWMFWPAKSDKSGTYNKQIAFLQSTAKIFADLPS